MVQFEWHDGKVKNLHVDLPSLLKYQVHFFNPQTPYDELGPARNHVKPAATELEPLAMLAGSLNSTSEPGKLPLPSKH